MGRFSDELRSRGRAVFSNWSTYDASMGTKLRLAARNRLRAASEGCCGNPGEPGC